VFAVKAPVPTAVLLLAVLFLRAASPKAVFLSPVVLFSSDVLPKAVLLMPVVFAPNEA